MMSEPNLKKEDYERAISTVTLGATQSEGGSRSSSYRIGGGTTPPFRYFEGYSSQKPLIAHDVFDVPISLPGHVREHFGDAMNDPAEWAKLRVKKFGAKAITLHMVSTDPKTNNTSIPEACKTIESVLSAVKVPLIIGGSGSPLKDPQLLEKAAEICSGEKVVLSTVDPDMDYSRVAKAAIAHDHSLISLVSMNPDEMRRLNKNLMRIGMKPENMIMDLFTGGVGYGVEYSISAMERCRLAGLRGDSYLALPIASATSNAWSAREAWMRNDSWGPREWRGPLWETMTASMALLAGADLFMMLHPSSIKYMESLIDSLYSKKKPEENTLRWLEL
jgi:acetyl-CoA decarbonylase/synthase complex subunit delta